MRKYLWSLLVAGVAGGISPAWGQEGELFDRLDANKDGVVTADEVPDDKQSLFERLVRTGDANGDKKLSKEEFIAGLKKTSTAAEGAPAARPDGPPAGGLGNISAKDIFNRLDKDGNGKIEKDEIPERMKENMGRVDSNSDGAVDLAEFEKVAQFFAGMAGRRPDAAPAGAPEGRPAGGPPPMGPILRALDTDGDGELSASEIADAAKSLAKLDRNGDGKLTRDEIGPPPSAAGRPDRPADRPASERPAVLGGEFMKRIIAADTNGDKKLSKEEAPDRLKENFERLDTNKDGQLDEAELRAAFQSLREGVERKKE
ncbi:hypothetical protein [Anatilimnocola floriformis]|uniref:hypothetical protein n=1 Tax=Anatilimnocola floriformis TaxID=2948575 RepID=UPI0020C27D6F|nr:hypothetical protein [Anatilimnocola floriformis]